MKLQSIYLLLVPALLSVSSCSDPEHSGFEQIPIELRASGNGEVTAKAQTIAQAFETTIFASKRDGIYTGIPVDADDEWKQNTTVQTDGSVSLSNSPTYPVNGDWIYLTAVAPQPASYVSASGSVSYTLTGQTDLMYAKQIKGNRWEGSRFSNTDNTKDSPLEYAHLLTQLKFKAKKATATGLTVKVQKITVKGKKTVSLDLASGHTTFSGNDEELALTVADGGKEIAATTPATDLGYLLLPPLSTGAYKLTVETSVGTFTDLNIAFESVGGSSSSSNQFAAGHSYEITLNIDDRELEILSVTVAEWTTTVQGDDLELVK